MLIINNAVLTDAIGSFFRRYNVLEYKSPEDSLSIDDFYKVQGYACLYKSSVKKIDSIKIEELTASIFRHTYPVKMFAALERTGLRLEEKMPGIYYVTGALCVPTQVIVTSRLSGDGYEAFKILAKNANKDDILKFLDSADKNSDINTSAILRVSVAANELLYQKLREENYSMGAWDRLLSAAEARGINIGRVEERKIIRERLIKAGINPLDADKYTELGNLGELQHGNLG